MGWRRGFAAAALAAMVAFPATGAEVRGAWSERVQVLYQPDTRSVARTRLRVWNPEPDKNLEFVWEPNGRVVHTPDGTVNGRGKLTWRVRGSASYDPSTAYSTYVGEMKDGRPDGAGRLVLRSGEVLEGQFLAGVMTGKGVSVDASGNRYEGDFVDGSPHGTGRLTTAAGEIYIGPFSNGLKHGGGQTRLASGSVYVSQWDIGKEVGRPSLLPDLSVSGILKTQSGKGAAAKVDIAFGLEQRLNLRAQESDGVAYQSVVRDDDVAFFPLDEQLNGLWNGRGRVDNSVAAIWETRDWSIAPAFAEVKVSTKDGSRVKLDKLELQVASSEVYRKPMLSIVEHLGCVGFRPAFSLTNYGWGSARNLTVNMSFAGAGNSGPRSRSFSRKFSDFDHGIDIPIRDLFEEAGVDTDTLDRKRFTCPAGAAMDVCKAHVMDQVRLGEVADHIWTNTEEYLALLAERGDPPYEVDPNGQFFTAAAGTLDYDWVDDAGVVHHASEPFRARIPLFYIDVPIGAECGAGWGQSPEAARFHDIHFDVGKSDYSLRIPLRGNKNVSSYTARLKLQAKPAMSSIHRFSVAAKFADGSVKTSKPASFFFAQPRIPEHTPTYEAAGVACYVPDELLGC